jgi:group I intron endonuclease
MAVVYKICHKSALYDEEYVGSTTRLRSRISQHKGVSYSEIDKNRNLPLYTFIREHGGWDDWDFHVLEEVRFDETEGAPSKKFQLSHRERYWIETLKPMLNCRQASLLPLFCECGQQARACRKCAPSDVYQEHLEKSREAMRKIRKDPIKYEIIKQKEKEARANSEYRAKINARNAERYNANKDKINARRRELNAIKRAQVVEQQV